MYTRRDLFRLTGGAVVGAAVNPTIAVYGRQAPNGRGVVIGQPEAARVGQDVLDAGGNAVDAAVAAGLAAGVVAIAACGIGGYGGHMVIAQGGKVTAIDFDTTAPRAARPAMFPLDENGAVRDERNVRGWLSAGVPGTLAGLQLAANRYGTKPFGKLIEPAIRLARDGFSLLEGQVNTIRLARAHLLEDAASARVLLKNGDAPPAGSTLRNPDLAVLLETLANDESVARFYEGSIARQIAAAFKKNGGLVTEEDLRDYRAREVAPLEFNWRGYSIRTAPLPAGGASVLQALGILRALGWERFASGSSEDLHARLEALRLAWDDRLRLFGDPLQVDVPLDKLLSEPYAKEQAIRVDKAVREGTQAITRSRGGSGGGTVHLSVADRAGNLVALTLTHGNPFGARVMVDGLGLMLGNGMARFEPRPGHANSIGPGKRPLTNMCPTVVLRNGRPIVALGGAGFRMIPNAVFEVLTRCVGRDATLEDAIAAPRLGTDGGTTVSVESASGEDAGLLRKWGYAITGAPIATANGVSFDAATGASRGAMR
jgi:gamma-glutamyltranspeptidase / glutathione hydrolase